MEINAQLAQQINKLCPHRFDEDELDKLRNIAIEKFNRDGLYLKKRYSSFIDVMADISRMLKSKHKVILDECANRSGTYFVKFQLPDNIVKQKLSEVLGQVEDEYQSNLERLQKTWLEGQLSEELEEQKQATLREIELSQKMFKQSLVNALNSGN